MEKKKYSQFLKEWSRIYSSIKENDLLIISTERKDFWNSSRDFLIRNLAPSKGSFICAVSKKMNKPNNPIGLTISNDVFRPFNSILKRMTDIKKDFYVYYYSSLSTILREFKALKCIEFSPFINYILNPSMYKDMLTEKSNEQRGYDSRYNKSQNKALAYVNSMNNNGLSLIQGPPGTGKTHTIHGILNMLHSSKEKYKILVCTPSNAACDEIVRRLAM